MMYVLVMIVIAFDALPSYSLYMDYFPYTHGRGV